MWPFKDATAVDDTPKRWTVELVSRFDPNVEWRASHKCWWTLTDNTKKLDTQAGAVSSHNREQSELNALNAAKDIAKKQRLIEEGTHKKIVTF